MLVFSGLLKLGFWQSDRAEEKMQRLNHIEQLISTKPFSLSDITSQISSRSLASVNDLPIRLSGTFDKEIIFLLDNQVSNGQLGYRVYQVLYQQELAVLVNLGWVLGSINRNVIPDITPLSGEVNFDGHVRIIEKGIVLMQEEFTEAKWPLRVQQIELVKFSQLISQELLPFVVYLDTKEEIGYKTDWKPIVMSPEKHRAYAFQWFSLAFAWLILMIFAFVKSLTAKKE